MSSANHSGSLTQKTLTVDRQRVPEDIPAEAHALIRQGVEYWRSIHPAHGLPGRQHIDPADIPELLANVTLVDVTGEPLQFKFRLMGTQAVHFFGRDLTGHWYHEAFDNYPSSPSYADLCTAVRTKKPHWHKGPPSVHVTKDDVEIERLVLPLAANGHDVDMLFLVQVFCHKLP